MKNLQMNRFNTISASLGLSLVLFLFASCGPGKNKPGRTFMPDMTYSQAQETYAPYASVKGDSISARMPVEGTVARGHMPYTFANTADGYAASAANPNPVAKTEKVMAEGGRLYGIYCTPCHGAGGAGDGPVAKAAADYGLQPPSYWDATIIGLPDGQMFHSMHHGKNLMGSYASQLTQEERWMIIHHINQLQDLNAVTSETPEVVASDDIPPAGDGTNNLN